MRLLLVWHTLWFRGRWQFLGREVLVNIQAVNSGLDVGYLLTIKSSWWQIWSYVMILLDFLHQGLVHLPALALDLALQLRVLINQHLEVAVSLRQLLIKVLHLDADPWSSQTPFRHGVVADYRVLCEWDVGLSLKQMCKCKYLPRARIHFSRSSESLAWKWNVLLSTVIVNVESSSSSIPTIAPRNLTQLEQRNFMFMFNVQFRPQSTD